MNARTSVAFSAVSASEIANGSTCGSSTLTVPSPPVSGGNLGLSSLDQNWSFSASRINDNGPNQGFDYVASASNSSTNPSRNTVYCYVISPDLKNTNNAFYQAQCGSYNAQTNPNGLISGADLLANAIRHESGAVQSHYNNYVLAQSDPSNNLGAVAEAQVGIPSVALATFVNNVSTTLGHKKHAIDVAFTVEPCGSSDVRLNASCTFQGYINFSPYQSCQ